MKRRFVSIAAAAYIDTSGDFPTTIVEERAVDDQGDAWERTLVSGNNVPMKWRPLPPLPEGEDPRAKPGSGFLHVESPLMEQTVADLGSVISLLDRAGREAPEYWAGAARAKVAELLARLHDAGVPR